MRQKLIVILLYSAVGSPSFAESPEQWFSDGQAAVEAAKRLTPISAKAKNVILFIGDGMGISTVTAARILAGQLQGKPGEENLLSFEKLPYLALMKTYATNEQTAASESTMTAIITGVKTEAGLLSVNQRATRGDYKSVHGNKLTTMVELAEQAGLSTGIVSTSRVTHATPAACYAHSPERWWEDDTKLPPNASKADFPDIARQLIEFPFGDGPEVVLGGGRQHFLPSSIDDPEHAEQKGHRADGRDLTKEWRKKHGAVYVWNDEQFNAINPATTKHLLGLFEPSHMQFEHDRSRDPAGEPSLTEMTAKAIDLLARNPKGYFLMVEAARIDHAHHGANAFRALTDTIELANAVETAMAKTDPQDTLLIVTADHGSPFVIAGYATRGNPILGNVIENDSQGNPEKEFALDALGLPYAALSYANGPGYTGASDEQPEGPKHARHRGRGYRGITQGRPDLTKVNTEDPAYLQECLVPLTSATHSGEDVSLYARGPRAHLFHGVMEQNVIFHVMADALGLSAKHPHTESRE